MKIGIIGGGQLGLMMAEAAKKYGMEIVGLDPNIECPLSRIADEMIIGNYNDRKMFELLVEKTDVVTYEFENVDLDLVTKFQKKIPQKAKGLFYSRNRLIEKKYVNELGITTPSFEEYKLSYQFEKPVIIKTTTGGYDGKGQYVIKNKSDLAKFIPQFNVEYIVEDLIPFDYEISVIATRDKFDTVVCFPIPSNTHKNGILHTSVIDNTIPRTIKEQAQRHTRRLIKELDYIGTLAVEYFVVGTSVVFNEFAPRPHNSGHYSIEACSVSQFENHIRAITGLEVIQPVLINSSLMLNVLGQDNNLLSQKYEKNIFVHNYFKNGCKENRKMGHITIVDSTRSKLITIKNKIVEERV